MARARADDPSYSTLQPPDLARWLSPIACLIRVPTMPFSAAAVGEEFASARLDNPS